MKSEREVLFYRYAGGCVLKPASAKGAQFFIVAIALGALGLGLCFLLQTVGVPAWLLRVFILLLVAGFFGACVFAWMRSEPNLGRRSWWYI